MAAFDLEPLPPWDELPWFKLEQAWYFARWNRIRRARRARRFCVERGQPRRAAPGRRVQITLLRHGGARAYAAARIAAGDARPPFAPARLAGSNTSSTRAHAKGRARPRRTRRPRARSRRPRWSSSRRCAAHRHGARRVRAPRAAGAARAAVVAHDACRGSCHCRNVCACAGASRRSRRTAVHRLRGGRRPRAGAPPSAAPAAAPPAAPSADEEEEDGARSASKARTASSSAHRPCGSSPSRARAWRRGRHALDFLTR